MLYPRKWIKSYANQYPHSQLTIYRLTSTLIHDLISHPAHLNTFCLNVAVVVIETIIPCLFQVAKGPSQHFCRSYCVLMNALRFSFCCVWYRTSVMPVLGFLGRRREPYSSGTSKVNWVVQLSSFLSKKTTLPFFAIERFLVRVGSKGGGLTQRA